jgi:hypothetical protein
MVNAASHEQNELRMHEEPLMTDRLNAFTDMDQDRQRAIQKSAEDFVRELGYVAPELKGPHQVFSTDSANAFLVHFAITDNFGESAMAAGMGYHTVARWVRDDEPFAAAKAACKQFYIGTLRAEMTRRGRDGVLEPVFYQGLVVDYVRKFSDNLLLRELEAHDPAYQRNVGMDHTVTKTVKHELGDQTREALAKLDKGRLAELLGAVDEIIGECEEVEEAVLIEDKSEEQP